VRGGTARCSAGSIDDPALEWEAFGALTWLRVARCQMDSKAESGSTDCSLPVARHTEGNDSAMWLGRLWMLKSPNRVVSKADVKAQHLSVGQIGRHWSLGTVSEGFASIDVTSPMSRFGSKQEKGSRENVFPLCTNNGHRQEDFGWRSWPGTEHTARALKRPHCRWRSGRHSACW